LSGRLEQDFDAVFFDLDGTLVDTAPDMVGALQELQREYGVPTIDYRFGRSNVSNGAIGLLRVGFPDLDEEFQEALVPSYLDYYAPRVCQATVIFPNLGELLEILDENSRPWGVVTNKPTYLTEPLMAQLGLDSRSSATVSGDTLTTRKPDPAPLLHACQLADVDPARSIYVGDAWRDIEAGRAAGMRTIAATYGYITDDDEPRGWGADDMVENTADLAQMILKAVTL
jgi:2-phosphoglycolate phosphatase